MTAPHRHRTAREKRAQASAEAAIARALAHTRPKPPEPDDDPWDHWPPSPAEWRARCRQIRLEIEETHRD